ncbi:DUF4160 domain-containing protein [Allorhizobium pseudoryzae]|uniref:DUF4160 domain-containing protein n=1 Tax=Allorhizobium pseudoryzae TaxID=379684 RepID=UPI0013ED3676|nr:DUF4160 domain-containing protein [Allorhizobium pseudoryzae]
MPVLMRLGNMKIMLFADDHNPPHFHVATPDHDALILIRDLSVLQGQITARNLQLVREWASTDENRKRLESEWKRLNER